MDNIPQNKALSQDTVNEIIDDLFCFDFLLELKRRMGDYLLPSHQLFLLRRNFLLHFLDHHREFFLTFFTSFGIDIA